MDAKSRKPLRLFNPLSIWTDFALKSGEAMLTAAQAAITRPKAPKVAVIHKASKPKARTARKNASSRAKRRAR
jgi:hypothetical protein